MHKSISKLLLVVTAICVIPFILQSQAWAVDFTAYSYATKSNSFKLSDQAGKAVVVFGVSGSCPYCVKEGEDRNALLEKFKAEVDAGRLLMYEMYLEESHPESSTPHKYPKTMQQYIENYETFVKASKTKLPGLIDDEKASWSKQFFNYSCVYLFDVKGEINYKEQKWGLTFNTLQTKIAAATPKTAITSLPHHGVSIRPLSLSNGVLYSLNGKRIEAPNLIGAVNLPRMGLLPAGLYLVANEQSAGKNFVIVKP